CANLDNMKYLVENNSLKFDVIPCYKDVDGSKIMQLKTKAAAARKGIVSVSCRVPNTNIQSRSAVPDTMHMDIDKSKMYESN
ncbi:hypothetical protein E2562_004654, partial [Oryza meyeriana var. granulata]